MQVIYPPFEDWKRGWMTRVQFQHDYPENGVLQNWYEEWVDEQERLKECVKKGKSG